MHNKKVLILAYDFPPYNSVASQRPASWLKYFMECEIYPTVITLHWDKKITNDQDYIIPSFNVSTRIVETYRGKTIRVPFKANLRDLLLHKFGFHRFVLIRKVLTVLYNTLRHSFFGFDSTRMIYQQARNELENNSYDIILATGEPFILFKYASLLSKKFSVPWVADYRDPWTNSHSISQSSGIINSFWKKYFRILEKKYVSNCKLAVTPSPSYKSLIEKLHSKLEVEIIFNGHDVDNLNELRQIDQGKDMLEMAYAGRIYDYQDLEVFLEGLKKFIERIGPKIKLRVSFYGLAFHHDNLLRLLNYDPGLNAYFNIVDRVKYDDLLRELVKANLLLLFSTKGANTLASKIFDYLPLNRKILLVTGDNGILNKIINETGGGEIFYNSDELASRLVDFYGDLNRNGRIESKSHNYEKYSRRYQAIELARLLLANTGATT